MDSTAGAGSEYELEGLWHALPSSTSSSHEPLGPYEEHRHESFSSSVSSPFAAFFSPRPSGSMSSTSQVSLPNQPHQHSARQTLDVRFDQTPLSATISDLLVDRLEELHSPCSKENSPMNEHSSQQRVLHPGDSFRTPVKHHDQSSMPRPSLKRHPSPFLVSTSPTPTKPDRKPQAPLLLDTSPNGGSTGHLQRPMAPWTTGHAPRKTHHQSEPFQPEPRIIHAEIHSWHSGFSSVYEGLNRKRPELLGPRYPQVSCLGSKRQTSSTEELVKPAASPPLGRRRSRSDTDIGAVPLAWLPGSQIDPFSTLGKVQTQHTDRICSSPRKPPRDAFFVNFGAADLKYAMSDITHLRTKISKRELQDLVGDAIQRQKGSALQMLSSAKLAQVKVEVCNLQRSTASLEISHRKAVQRRHSFQLLLFETLEACDITTAQRAAGTLARVSEHCDRLVQELHWNHDKLKRLMLMQQMHSCSASSLALGKINAAFLRELQTNDSLRKDLQAGRSRSATIITSRPEEETETLRPEVDTQTHHTSNKSRVNNVSSARFSSASLASLTKFSFPVPPARCRLEEPEIPSHPVVVQLEVDYTPKSSRRRQTQRSASIDILILPPEGPRKHDPADGLPSSAVLPLTPFPEHNERRSSLSISRLAPSFESANALTANSFLLRASARRQSTPTPTLDLSKSIRRAKRGRQTQVEGPESILMALATASWWTNPDLLEAHEDGLM